MDSTIYKKVESYLMDIITQNSNIPDYKLPSERALSISFNTSRKPIRHAYERLIQKGYVINIHGRGYFIHNTEGSDVINSAHASPQISLIIPSIQTQFDHSILAGIHNFCSSHQVELSIHVSNSSVEKEASLLHTVPLSGSKGIILFPADNDVTYHDELLKLSLRKYPLVLLDRMLSNIHASFISSENHQAMVDAVEFLKNKNYNNIVYITVPASVASTNDARINGFTHGLLRHYKMAKPQNLLVIEEIGRAHV